MRLQIIQITDRGVPFKERLHLRALTDLNLTNYCVFNTSYINPQSVRNIPKGAYWFSSQQVKAGDNIILYSGAGTQSSQVNSFGPSNYFFTGVYHKRFGASWEVVPLSLK